MTTKREALEIRAIEAEIADKDRRRDIELRSQALNVALTRPGAPQSLGEVIKDAELIYRHCVGATVH